jgi:G protein-coupled receptor 158
LPEGPILAKDLAIEYKYLSNTSEWFFIARKRAESVIKSGKSYQTSKSESLKKFVLCRK